MFDPMRKYTGLSEGSRHVIRALLLFLGAVTFGVVGYVIIEGSSFSDALYMTIITISTVGFGEVPPLSQAGRYFTIVLIVTGVSALLFFFTAVFEFILSEYFGDIWGRRKMQKRILGLSGHYVVCGYGRVGRSVADELMASGKQFVVIEVEDQAARECANNGYLVIHGSATDTDVLKRANIEKALGLVSALKEDADNLYVILSARVLRPDLLLVARADQPEAMEKLEMVGADRVISPHMIAGKRMANLLVKPVACDFLDVAVSSDLPEYQLTEQSVEEGSMMDGKTIRGTRLRETTGVTVLSIRKKGEKQFNPNPPADTLIEQGDVLLMIGTPQQMASLEERE